MGVAAAQPEHQLEGAPNRTKSKFGQHVVGFHLSEVISCMILVEATLGVGIAQNSVEEITIARQVQNLST